MNFFSVAYCTLIRNVRDKKSFINKLLMPIVLIVILGTALSNVFATDELDQTKVAYLNTDQGEVSQNFTAFLDQKEVKELLDVKIVKSLHKGKELVEKGDVTSLIYIDPTYSAAIVENKDKPIQVYSSNDGDYHITVVNNIVDSFIQGANTVQAVTAMGEKTVGLKSFDLVEDKTITASGNRPRAIDYYAVTMLILCVMYGAIYSSESMSEYYHGKLGERIKISPVSDWQLIAGQMFGILITNLLQITIVFLISKLVFNANWGSNYLAIFGIVFSLSFMATSIGALVAILTKDSMRASGILAITIPIMTFIAGGYVKLDLEELMYLSPNYLAQTAIFNNIYGGSALQSQVCLSVIWAITACVIISAFFASRRRFV
ncbi:ABC transporter permease [Viridibacillus sp. YIM B01967]|uniref:ABC transporter permease n=1 Tax=Viridibacillus soli TaxID=2798301 RepID=A0ABS1H622_9BACL|nr:ABC transporter permease [Viridibacillus soli]MBK3494736.1 ABC transporter permease [Viridibacillus soli]